jgi:hypothetical protein
MPDRMRVVWRGAAEDCVVWTIHDRLLRIPVDGSKSRPRTLQGSYFYGKLPLQVTGSYAITHAYMNTQ